MIILQTLPYAGTEPGAVTRDLGSRQGSTISTRESSAWVLMVKMESAKGALQRIPKRVQTLPSEHGLVLVWTQKSGSLLSHIWVSQGDA